MTFEPLLLVYCGIFLGILLAFEGFRQSLSRRVSGEAAKSRRMRMLAAGTSRAEVLQILRAPDEQSLLARVPGFDGLAEQMRRAGMAMKPKLFLALCLLAAAMFVLLGLRVAQPLLVIPSAVLLCIWLPVMSVRMTAKKRMDRLVAQLPDALDLMARGLKVGHPLNTTIASVATDMPDPIGTEFGIVLDQVSYGDDLVSALRELADRVDLEDVRYLSSSIAIQHGTGGNLARVLSVLSKVIRDRAAMRRKIRAISSEGRLSAIILSALPPGIFAVTSATTPDYYGGVRGDPLFLPTAVIIVVLVVTNALVLRKLVNFKF